MTHDETHYWDVIWTVFVGKTMEKTHDKLTNTDKPLLANLEFEILACQHWEVLR
jgi:hypothetical protein